MRILLFGATGLVGDGVLRWLIASPCVDQVVAVSRKPLQVRHAKLDTVIEADMFHLQQADVLTGFDACFFGSSGILVASGSQFETAAMEVDRDLEVPFVAESASGVLYPLNLGVDGLAGSIRYPMA